MHRTKNRKLDAETLAAMAEMDMTEEEFFELAANPMDHEIGGKEDDDQD